MAEPEPMDPAVSTEGALPQTAEPARDLLTREDYREFIESLVSHLQIEILATDRSGKVTVWNNRIAEHYPEVEEPFGRSILEIFPWFREKREGIRWEEVLFRHVLQEGRTIDVRRHPMDGRFYNVRAFPIACGDRILGAAMTLRDVSGQVEIEEELQRQARTASLANLGASVAHEIRNPLNSLGLNIQILKENLDTGTPEAREENLRTIETVLEEIARMNSIVRDFLQFARPPRTKMEFDDPNETVLAALRLLEGEIRKEDVEVTVELDTAPKILMDRERLREAVYNLALNAIQAMHARKTRRLTVTSRVRDGTILIRLADSGPGIPPEIRPRLFDLFFSTKPGGTGLGLAHTDAIVKAHRGRLSVESGPGKGAAFAIALPTRVILGSSEGTGGDDGGHPDR